ncbi:MAG: glycosyltransferase family 2 protein [Methanobrevibacter boviskoreani]|jgi:glycosyltransferase involved in cell wall biosynthesis|uniref:glycosyltransferase family 2 protein n=1 Tax=Methanobrevibacter TaxID=2172 RepID=UPI0003348CA5|nr:MULTISPECIES: glycosyltransferase family 2 protein [Methanobrevibacter]AGN17564.1 glycosyl transferase GT2 family [Methanobrevibacter sp. AbM4]MCI6775598.1 glycosyltransferase family 2 protein [Methanobrevibacter boviskoreani]MCI6930512.1 glycosyltransferase family 2 protein [Methanobrevibacter boviskoreani]MDD6257036.1 glycosyltransferase family 2 protein [Methanobrevibacter boviskoreani]MDY5614881.1 glycosyltransferase family 2 protein [Methanobrevibacter boviskoreani]
MSDFNQGISIIVPTYKGEKYILKLLDSLKNQTLDKNLFDALFIINGERDNSESIIKRFKSENTDLNIEIMESQKGVSNARNLALDTIDREYCIFIDVDDYISYNYLEELYKHRKSNRIVLGNFFNVDLEGNLSKTYFSDTLLENNGLFHLYDFDVNPLLITTNKLVPTIYANKVRFNPNLYNGVDLDYFFKLYSKFDFEFYIVDNEREAIYYRVLVPGSISRQDMSFQFNVVDRLKVMKSLDNTYRKSKDKEKIFKLLDFIVNVGQKNFIVRYIEKHPEDYFKALYEIESYHIENFDYLRFFKCLDSLDVNTQDNIKDINNYIYNLYKKENTFKKENQNLKKELDFKNKLLKTRPYRLAASLRKMAMKLRGRQ